MYPDGASASKWVREQQALEAAFAELATLRRLWAWRAVKRHSAGLP
jgi:hypothetical protein